MNASLELENAKRFYPRDIPFYHQLDDNIVVIPCIYLLPLWHCK